jgi:hypothetical protein
MSLNWSTERVVYFKENPDELWVEHEPNIGEKYSDVNAQTKTMIFGSMAVGIGNITDANAKEWYARWKIMEKYDNISFTTSFVDGEWVDNKLTPDVVEKHIGLSTNVSYIKNSDWATRLAKDYIRKNINVSVAEIKSLITVFALDYKEQTRKKD